MSSGLQIRETAGGGAIGLMGGDRLGWIHSNALQPLFAVIIIQNARLAYYDYANPADPERQEKRERWYADVAAWEVKAARMTERNLWWKLNLLLVHPMGFHDALRPLMPPEDFSAPFPYGGIPPYPSHINPPDAAVIPWKPDLEMVRYTFEQSGSDVYPRLMYLDYAANWPAGYLWPGLPAWEERSVRMDPPVYIGIHRPTNQQWVQWATLILDRFV